MPYNLENDQNIKDWIWENGTSFAKIIKFNVVDKLVVFKNRPIFSI